MSLPSVKEVGKYYPWTRNKIKTKTLELRPFEKSDMSPYLVHMTSENAIKSIIESGTLNATTPSQSISQWYDQKIVCFTETPLFSIDFFRYKSHDRWLNDLRYGIGFSKKALADRGVRPALYIDRSLIRSIASIRNFEMTSYDFKLYQSLASLMTPLDHNTEHQGFMWEREWRYPNENGFNFDLADIKIICCPNDEAVEISELLGEHTNNITFVETWGEYEEVSKYLESRRNSNEMRLVVNSSGVDELRTAKLELNQELLKLDAYKNQLFRFARELESVEQAIPEIKSKIEIIDLQLKERQDWFESHCSVCMNSFEEFSLVPHPWEPDNGLDTWICIDCKLKTGT